MSEANQTALDSWIDTQALMDEAQGSYADDDPLDNPALDEAEDEAEGDYDNPMLDEVREAAIGSW